MLLTLTASESYDRKSFVHGMPIALWSGLSIVTFTRPSACFRWNTSVSFATPKSSLPVHEPSRSSCAVAVRVEAMARMIVRRFFFMLFLFLSVIYFTLPVFSSLSRKL